jgi:hypothetical protein
LLFHEDTATACSAVVRIRPVHPLPDPQRRAPQGGTHNGWIGHGRLVTPKPADGTNGFYEIW